MSSWFVLIGWSSLLDRFSLLLLCLFVFGVYYFSPFLWPELILLLGFIGMNSKINAALLCNTQFFVPALCMSICILKHCCCIFGEIRLSSSLHSNYSMNFKYYFQIISCQSSNTTMIHALRPYVESIWALLLLHCECQEEGTRNTVAECQGKRTLINLTAPMTRSTVVTAVKFTISDHVSKSLFY